MTGRFITFEGIDGAGKSTHIPRVRDWLQSRGKTVVVTREPGGTVLGEKLRALLLSRDEKPDPDTELLLMFAARRQHLTEVVWPALAKGQWVLCDRFTDATFAYQGGGRGIDETRIEALAQWVHPGFAPDLTLLFDLSTTIAADRAGQRAAPDRFEAEAEAFHRRVRDAYRHRAEREPHRFAVIDASSSVDVISKQLEDILSDRCK
ncbi:MAG: dTMP kinase [Burkholderiales bacterium]|nr:dTMP kinase [Burkholderiales bacterium]